MAVGARLVKVAEYPSGKPVSVSDPPLPAWPDGPGTMATFVLCETAAAAAVPVPISAPIAERAIVRRTAARV
jgi:hypothetical protein